MAEIFALRGLRILRLLLLLGSLAPSLLLGADKEEKAPFDPKKAEDAGVGMPTPYDKFLALDQALTATKVNWGQVLRKVAVDIDPDAFTDKEVAIPMVLGVRIADGVMAIKALDAEMLNKCAADIEKLAKKLNISDAELGRARAVRAAANKGEWLKVFMELGFFQQDIMKKIEDKEHSNRGTLLIVCGWMQGARYTTTVVGENYSPAVSGILREPLLAKALKDKVEGLSGPIKQTPAVTKLREALPKIEQILTIPLDGTISKENVAEINRLATEIVQGTVATSTAPASASSP
ncbi:MAG TPA: hypothetical protein VJS88_07725 [Chthoniobacterales bacterium]|nr:hypothetical protein [Chthoniobacterales bacterium]